MAFTVLTSAWADFSRFCDLLCLCFRAVQCPVASIACTEIATYRLTLSAESVQIEKKVWIRVLPLRSIESSFCGKLWISHLSPLRRLWNGVMWLCPLQFYQRFALAPDWLFLSFFGVPEQCLDWLKGIFGDVLVFVLFNFLRQASGSLMWTSWCANLWMLARASAFSSSKQNRLRSRWCCAIFFHLVKLRIHLWQCLSMFINVYQCCEIIQLV